MMMVVLDCLIACLLLYISILTGPSIFIGDVNPKSIIQGDLEDCYLLSALSVLAKNPSTLKNLFLVHEYNDFGLYGMCFYCDGEWRSVFVDDQFPVSTKTGKLVFAHSFNEKELWVPILEKCYAKLYNGYNRIIGGLVHESFKDLTGGASDEMALDNDKQAVYDGRLWKKLAAYHKEGYLMGCGNPKVHTSTTTR